MAKGLMAKGLMAKGLMAKGLMARVSWPGSHGLGLSWPRASWPGSHGLGLMDKGLLVRISWPRASWPRSATVKKIASSTNKSICCR